MPSRAASPACQRGDSLDKGLNNYFLGLFLLGKLNETLLTAVYRLTLLLLHSRGFLLCCVVLFGVFFGGKGRDLGLWPLPLQWATGHTDRGLRST